MVHFRWELAFKLHALAFRLDFYIIFPARLLDVRPQLAIHFLTNLSPGLLLQLLGCFIIDRTFPFNLQRVLWSILLTCLADRSDYKGRFRCCALCTLITLGLLMLVWQSGFQRPYPIERGAQRTIDFHRGVLSIAVAYVVPIIAVVELRIFSVKCRLRVHVCPKLLCLRRRSPVCCGLFCDGC